MWWLLLYDFPFNLGSQTNGGLYENCLKTFIPNNDDRTNKMVHMIENDFVGDVGFKLMCECNILDQNQETGINWKYSQVSIKQASSLNTYP